MAGEDVDVGQRVAAFREDLSRYSTAVLVQKHITYGASYALDQERYFELKSDISARYDLHPSEVLLVGSGKLGFSIAPTKRYRPFGNESDLDIALVSPRLFDMFWEFVYDYWKNGGFWAGYNGFRTYLFRGWIRPDKLPSELSQGREWWEFFQNLTRRGDYGPYHIRGGIYRSWRFLESYQARAMESCKSEAG